MNARKLILLLLLGASFCGMAQKTLSEGTLTFDISVQTGNKDPQMADMFDGAKAIIQLRGSLSRSELISALGSTATIYDHRAGAGVVLREFGSQKLLIRMTKEDWADKNRKYEGIRFEFKPETKVIAGYPCERAEAILPDKTTFSVYFTRQLLAENTAYDPQFKLLPGTALEYESTAGSLRIRYTATSVSFDPVPMQRFEIPKSGYREMNYAESMRRN